MCVPSRSGRWWYSVEKIVNVRRLTSSSLKKITIDWILVYELQKQAQRQKKKRVSETVRMKNKWIQMPKTDRYWIRMASTLLDTLYARAIETIFPQKNTHIFQSLYFLPPCMSLYLSTSLIPFHSITEIRVLFPYYFLSFSHIVCVCARVYR